MDIDKEWITKPLPMVAHRGLHDAKNGIIENSIDAITAAIDHGFGIEIDVQLSQDDKVIVFHDFDLERLTGHKGHPRDLCSEALTQIQLLSTPNTIPTLDMVLALIPINIPIFIEIKVDETRDGRKYIKTIIEKIELICKNSNLEQIAIMSFNPQIYQIGIAMDIAHPLGLIAEWDFTAKHWLALSEKQRRSRRFMVSRLAKKPDFISYDVNARHNFIFKLWQFFQPIPECYWTVKNPKLAYSLLKKKKIPTFEGFRPRA